MTASKALPNFAMSSGKIRNSSDTSLISLENAFEYSLLEPRDSISAFANFIVSAALASFSLKGSIASLIATIDFSTAVLSTNPLRRLIASAESPYSFLNSAKEVLVIVTLDLTVPKA